MIIDVKMPAFAFSVENEVDIITRATSAITANVRSRLASGMGAHGALPSPKDGGRAMNRSGQLAGSIGYRVDEKSAKNGKRAAVGVVRAMGDRSDAATRKASSKARQKMLRAAFVLGESMANVVTGKPSAHRSAKTGKLKLSKVRARSGATNGAVVAILAQPPKDQRSKNGGRGIYTLFAPNAQDERTLKDVAEKSGVYTIALRSR